MHEIPTYVGSFVGMFLFARLWLWFARGWPDSVGKILFVYLSLGTFIILLDFYTRSDNGVWAGEKSLALHAPALLILLVFDLVRVLRTPRAVPAQ
jgi:hypothetical protein